MSRDVANVFISHVHEDDSRLGALKSLMASSGLDVRDGSINSDKPNSANNKAYIKSAILAPRIRWAGSLVVLISPQTKQSEWVNWEIEYAQSLGKKIIGVWDHGAANCDIPDALDAYADAVVGWQGARVIDAIAGKINSWETPEGALRERRQIPRYGC